GRRARAQAAGVAGSDGERAGEDHEGSGAAKEEASEGGGDRAEGGEGAGALQDGQALRLPDRSGQLRLDSPRRFDSAGSAVGRDLRAADQRTARAAVGGRDGAQLQESVGSGASFSKPERDRSVGSTDSASHRGSGAGAYIFMPVGVLRGMASAESVGAAFIRRRGAERRTETTRSDPARETLGIGQGKEEVPPDSRGASGAE